ncbi:hypothetical protein MPNT_30086 [Candidatus Methylacidithermus pantelleriae]|uniref:Uncharacterized protein n=1 Tax=Candidatus Methylacidithermus pantelleriae TaxID=2744239 RepID=A0A8J2BNM1_9BACT|nr:hypothetical protein MPNT_30086 [Candidatus Methylacidithermus pantelleriae]
MRKLLERIGRGEKMIHKLEEKNPGSNVLPKKKRRLAIVPTEPDALLAEEESQAGAFLFRFPPPLLGKSVFWKKTDTPTLPTGRGMGSCSGKAPSVSSGRRTKPPRARPAKPRYPRTGNYRLRMRLPEG